MPMSLIPNAAKQTIMRWRAGCRLAQTSEPMTMPAAIALKIAPYEPTPRW